MKNIIPMTNDRVFKKIWGDPSHPDRIEYMSSAILHIPVKKLKGKVEVIESEKRKYNLKDKDQRVDIAYKIALPNKQKINIELNVLKEKSDGIITRNISYAAFLFLSDMNIGDKYDEVSYITEVNFNTFSIHDDDKVISKYYIQDKEGNKLTSKLQFLHINIEKCNDVCYTEDELDNELIKIGKLIKINKVEELDQCLGEMDMDERTKTNLMNDMFNLSSDEEIVTYFNSEEDRIKIQNTLLSEATDKGFNEGSKKEKIRTAKDMLKEGIDESLILKITELSIEEINSLR